MPPTDGISDPHIRQFLDALKNAWGVRNGAGRESERFVRAGEIEYETYKSLAKVLSGGSSVAALAGLTGGVADPSAVYNSVLNAVNDMVLRSEAYSLLRTPVQAIDAPTFKLKELQDRIAKEAEDRANAIAAEAAARGSGITSEQIARETADDALQTQIDTIVATGGGDTATILAALYSEQTARIAADTAEATQRNLLATQMRGAYTGNDPALLTSGLLYTERLARITAVDAVVANVSSLLARVGDAESAITAEQTARASADTSLASSVSSLWSSIGSSNAAILSEASTRSNKDNSLAQAINTLWSSIGGSSALIQDGALAAVSPAGVAATKWLQVQAAVTDPDTGQVNGASIKSELNAYASAVNGTLNATWAIRANVNGVISGVSLMTSSGAGSGPGALSNFAIMADRLTLVNPSNHALQATAFSVDSGGNAVFAGTIYAMAGVFGGALSAASGTFAGALVGATGTFSGSLTAPVVYTENIVGAAVSTAYGASSSGTSASVTITVPAGARSVMVWAFFSTVREDLYGGGDTGFLGSFILPASGTISSPLGTNSDPGATGTVHLNPPAGTYTITASRSYTPASSGHVFAGWGGKITMLVLLTKR